jgi:hypothetical protein
VTSTDKKIVKMYKPRAGDWDCSACGLTKIFARRDICPKCRVARVKETPSSSAVETKNPAIPTVERKTSAAVTNPYDEFIDSLEWDDHPQDVRDEISGKISRYLHSLAIVIQPATRGKVVNATCSLCGATNASSKCPHDSYKYDCDYRVCEYCLERYHTCGYCIQVASGTRHIHHAQRARYCRDHGISLALKPHKGGLRLAQADKAPKVKEKD